MLPAVVVLLAALPVARHSDVPTTTSLMLYLERDTLTKMESVGDIEETVGAATDPSKQLPLAKTEMLAMPLTPAYAMTIVYV